MCDEENAPYDPYEYRADGLKYEDYPVDPASVLGGGSGANLEPMGFWYALGVGLLIMFPFTLMVVVGFALEAWKFIMQFWK